MHLESERPPCAESCAAQPMTGNLFFALYPDAATARRIAVLAHGLRREHGLAGKPLKTENLHISLQHLSGFVGSPRARVDAACAAAMAMASCSFDVILDVAGSFARNSGDRHPFVLLGREGVVAVETFHRALRIAMRRAGFGTTAAGFTPHLTLLYDHRRVGLQCIDLVRWRVNEFVLVESLVGHATHVPLGRWRLGSRGRPHRVELDRGFISAAGVFRTFDQATIA
jgi:RNA 2',3'-cyclic 3'-phosphodiesterase